MAFYDPIIGLSQNGNYQSGARSASMGEASVAIHDPYAMFNNISGIAKEEVFSGSLSFENRFGISSFNTVTAGIVVPKDWGNTTLNFFRFGDDVFNEQKIGLGYAHNISMVSLGAQVNYVQYFIEGYGSKGAFVLEVGGIAEIIPELIFGAHIYNITQSQLSATDDERIATTLKAGLSFRPINKIMINVESQKEITSKVKYKLGLEYEIINHLYLRSGFSPGSGHGYHGIGFLAGRFMIDYALSNSFQLGFSHYASLTYKVSPKKL